MDPIELSNYAGLATIGVLTANILLGLLIATKYNPVRNWPHRRINTVRIHNLTGYAALGFALLHPTLLLLPSRERFGLLDLLYPLHAPKQPVVNTLGALALYLLTFVVVTSYLWNDRRVLSRATWKRLHFATYALFPLYAVHAILTDPNLKNTPVDPFDAEKVFVELCVLAVVVAITGRIRWQRRQPPAGLHREKQPRPLAAPVVSLLLTIALSTGSPQSVTGQASAAAKDWSYNPDAGLVYRRGDFRWTSWGFAERYWGPHSDVVKANAWRRVRQGMEFDLPGTIGILGSRLRPAAVYEVDLNNTDFFRAGRASQVFENLYAALEDSRDEGRFRLVIGENTHIISREDNLPSGNLPTINRSLILEEHGSVNSFGTQWGAQVRHTLGAGRYVIAISAQDNRGSLNAASPHYQVGNSAAVKLGALVVDDTIHHRRLALGAGTDYTRDITNRTFTLASAIGAEALGGTVVAGDKLTFEGDAAYSALLWKRPFTLEGEFLFSDFSHSRTDAWGAYAQFQISIFDAPHVGQLDPFVRYDVVRLWQASMGTAVQQAVRLGANYNLPHTGKFANLHLEYALNQVSGPAVIVPAARRFGEFRVGFRLNAARYVRH